MTLNDAHIFCTPDQIKSEFTKVMQLVETGLPGLGHQAVRYRLSLGDKTNKEKYVANDEMWALGERVLREAMDSLGLPYIEAPGEAAFYGPKLDIQLADVMGHEETYSTIQIDFHLPNQFDLKYVGADGQEHRPVMIHRAIVSTMERMISYLIELYGGAFPVWLAPFKPPCCPSPTGRTTTPRKSTKNYLCRGPGRDRYPQRQSKLQDPRSAAAKDSLHACHRRSRSAGR